MIVLHYCGKRCIQADSCNNKCKITIFKVIFHPIMAVDYRFPVLIYLYLFTKVFHEDFSIPIRIIAIMWLSLEPSTFACILPAFVSPYELDQQVWMLSFYVSYLNYQSSSYSMLLIQILIQIAIQILIQISDSITCLDSDTQDFGIQPGSIYDRKWSNVHLTWVEDCYQRGYKHIIRALDSRSKGLGSIPTAGHV